VAWITRHFDEAPQIVNLFDPRLMTRRDLLASMTERGWNGRVVWVPISAIAAGVSLASAAISLLKRQRPVPVAAWSILRPRRFDGTLASQVLAASRAPARPVRDEAVAV
jgi:hypothetical protein